MMMEHTFDSISEFINYLEKSPINTDVFDCDSISSIDGSYDFTKTGTFAEAVKLCRFCNCEEIDDIYRLKFLLARTQETTSKIKKQYNYYVGYTPDVKSYLEGSPLAMFNSDRIKDDKKNVNIYYNIGVSCETDTKQIQNRGSNNISSSRFARKYGI